MTTPTARPARTGRRSEAPAHRTAAAASGDRRPASPASPARRVLRVLAIVACLPYIALKVTWIGGGRIGIPDGSALLDHPTAMAVGNSLTVLADAVVVLLALLLTRPWGLRVRAWLLVLPMWAATGLLAPIMAGYPAQLVVALVTGQDGGSSGPADEPFLDAWVFPVVYGGFIVQGLALGALFALYARDRWGHVWAGRLGELPAGLTGTRVRAGAVAATVLALLPAALTVLWACGSTAGLSPELAARHDADRATVDAVRALFLVLAPLATLLLVTRRPAGLRTRTAMALTWVGSAAVGCWGAYMSLVSLLPLADPGKEPTGLMITAYAGEMITGFLLAGCLAVVLRRRGPAGG
ncbi:hypothetical protein ACF09L_22950 [Streptomyces sp. NPDC014779]|uniref:hypothetical protein n=1 Tax=unclassified Streptomyces TaxID=2593676 RepID=UPI0037036A68